MSSMSMAHRRDDFHSAFDPSGEAVRQIESP